MNNEDNEEIDTEIHELLGNNFEIQTYKSTSDFFKDFRNSLDERGVCLSSQNHWRAAWQRFENTSEQYIQRIPAIRINNKDPLKLQKHRTEYKRRAVRNFLPFLKNRLPYLKGKAKTTSQGAIYTLESWKSQLHIQLPKFDEISFENEPIPAEPYLSNPPSDGQLVDAPVLPESQTAPGGVLANTINEDFSVLLSDDDRDFELWEKSVNSDSAQSWERSSFLHAYRNAESEFQGSNL